MNSSSYTDVFIEILAGKGASRPIKIRINHADPADGALRLDDKKLLEASNRHDEREYGSLLFGKLLAGDTLAEYTKAIGKGLPLRVRLSIDEGARKDVAHWNWECMFGEFERTVQPLAANAKTPFSRYIALRGETTWKPLRTHELRILVTLANPKLSNLADIQVDKNVESLLDFLTPVSTGPKLKVTVMPGYMGVSAEVESKIAAAGWRLSAGPTSIQSVQLQLAKNQPNNFHIWHHIGHGALTSPSNTTPGAAPERTVLYLESSSNDGQPEWWDDQDLAGFIGPQAAKPYLVFLDACEGANRPAHDMDPLFGMGPKLVAAGVPAVVAMQDKIKFDVVTMIQVFYRQLLSNGEVDVAMNEARSQIAHRAKKTGRLAFDWAIPVLFMRLEDGRLFASNETIPRERVRFDGLIQEYTKLFAGRDIELAELEAYMQRPTGGYLLVTAGAGLGKTALMASLVDHHRNELAYHFFSPNLPECLQEELFLRNLLEQMAPWYNINAPLPGGVGELRKYYDKFLGESPQGNLTVVLDGLDEVTDWKLSRYVTRRLPEGLHFILTVRDVGQDPIDTFSLPKEQVQLMPTVGLTREGVQAVFRAAGGKAIQFAEDDQLLKQVLRVALYDQNRPELGADSLFVRFLAEDAAAGDLRSDAMAQMPAQMATYLERWWKALKANAAIGKSKKKQVQQALADLVGTLAVTLGPIGVKDLEALYPKSLVNAELEDYVAEAAATVRRIVVRDQHNRYSLIHPRLREYVRSMLKSSDRAEKLADYCSEWATNKSPYALTYYARHLDEAERSDALAALFADDQWLHARVANADYTYDGYVADLKMAWQHARTITAHQIEAGDPPATLADCFRYALIHTTINQLSGN